MNKKVLLIIIIIAIVFSIFQFGMIHSSQDFDGHFTMDIPLGDHYSDVAWCRANGALGCKGEYWEDNAGCELDDGEMVVYYYNNSLLVEGESNAWQHAVNDLTTSYLYEIYQNDGNSLILTTDIDMRNMPPYLVGKVDNDGSEAVFVGSRNLDDAMHYANTIEFSEV